MTITLENLAEAGYDIEYVEDFDGYESYDLHYTIYEVSNALRDIHDDFVFSMESDTEGTIQGYMIGVDRYPHYVMRYLDGKHVMSDRTLRGSEGIVDIANTLYGVYAATETALAEGVLV